MLLDTETKQFVENHQISYFSNLLSNYNSTAIIINGCYVALERYEDMPELAGLSTAANIPEDFRLPIEVDYVYGRKELIKAYQTTVVQKITADYIVTTVTNLEAFLEELYAKLLKVTNNVLSQEEIDAKLGQAMWRNESFKNFILPFLKPTSKMKANGWEPSAWFYSLEEIRIVRHTLVHTGGKFSQRNLTKLRKLNQSSSRKNKSILDTHYVVANELRLDYTFIYSLRKWAYDLVFYICGTLLDYEGNSDEQEVTS